MQVLDTFRKMVFGPFDRNSKLEEERIAALHYKQYKDEKAALKFVEKLDLVWPHVATIYADKYTAGYYMLTVLKRSPKATISAHNLRLAAGQQPKFSKRIRASQ